MLGRRALWFEELESRFQPSADLTLAVAVPLSVDSPAQVLGTVETPGDVDVFAIVPSASCDSPRTESTTLRIEFCNLPAGSRVELFDADGVQASTDDPTVHADPDSPVTLYVAVTGAVTCSGASYDLKIEEFADACSRGVGETELDSLPGTDSLAPSSPEVTIVEDAAEPSEVVESPPPSTSGPTVVEEEPEPLAVDDVGTTIRKCSGTPGAAIVEDEAEPLAATGVVVEPYECSAEQSQSTSLLTLTRSSETDTEPASIPSRVSTVIMVRVIRDDADNLPSLLTAASTLPEGAAGGGAVAPEASLAANTVSECHAVTSAATVLQATTGSSPIACFPEDACRFETARLVDAISAEPEQQASTTASMVRATTADPWGWLASQGVRPAAVSEPSTLREVPQAPSQTPIIARVAPTVLPIYPGRRVQSQGEIIAAETSADPARATQSPVLAAPPVDQVADEPTRSGESLAEVGNGQLAVVVSAAARDRLAAASIIDWIMELGTAGLFEPFWFSSLAAEPEQPVGEPVAALADGRTTGGPDLAGTMPPNSVDDSVLRFDDEAPHDGSIGDWLTTGTIVCVASMAAQQWLHRTQKPITSIRAQLSPT